MKNFHKKIDREITTLSAKIIKLIADKLFLNLQVNFEQLINNMVDSAVSHSNGKITVKVNECKIDFCKKR